ncbi:MAG TPA: asparagine--tRNA ligase [Anaerohalosphaeraceae bacterium]|nr:asparagine--tRNA ligase [Anaerohalosphaeraceae bacterium]HOL30976.1 asparagine--tRNA ligase [Anaerohalosphaeraceae bacterium]HOM76238.1 asparagine--tRNA ligase [Anaerohalosphaeraceae bacterium]HPC63379.1 asparagine--tRNA ligase [Anaerohalosphaeraceae bacterium]HPO69116.1 asparagine--tRNA ligase [Anaerohalosphaeraceae bacterium]
MMPNKKVFIRELKNYIGQQVRLDGWLYNSRSSGRVLFLMLRDGTGLCQCVAEAANLSKELFVQLEHLGQESSLSVGGTIRAEPRSPGGLELAVSDAIIHCPAADYPITPKEHGIDFLLKNRHLHLRSLRPWCIGRIRHTVIDAIRRFFNDNGFILVDTPIFTTIAGEGEQTLFEVDYFGQPMHLAQTGQLYLEAAAMSFGKVYCFGPTFRAEKSKTRRHLTEFWMVEPEVAYIDLPGLLELAEDFVFSIIQGVLRNNRAELETLGADIAALEAIQKPFVRLTYSEAAEILTSNRTKEFMAAQLEGFLAQKKAYEEELNQLLLLEAKGGLKKWQQDKTAGRIIELRGELAELQVKIENNPKHAQLAADFQWGKDLGGSDETIISLMHNRPVFVTHYPKKAKAFYMKTDRSREEVVENFDLLAPAGFGEIIGGSIREDNYERLLARIRQEGYNLDSYQWYLDLRKYGSVPHGGFGLGVERTVAWLTGEKHIRQCIAFPRLMDKVYL